MSDAVENDDEIVPDLTIRRATFTDVPELAEFIKPFVAQGRLLHRTMMELEILVANCFVAVYQGKIVGCAALEIYSNKLAELRSLAVASEVRRLGIGKKLVTACVECAKKLEILEVMAITSSEEFFKACGFEFTLPGEKKALFIQTRDLELPGRPEL
jgi:amino-acid N-acetyltransferase